MITIENNITEIRQAIKELFILINDQRESAKTINLIITDIPTIKLNSTKVALIEWYNNAIKIYKLNDIVLEVKEIFGEDVITDNSDFYQTFVDYDHSKWINVKMYRYLDSILFMENGEFIETYAGDAVKVATFLGLKLGVAQGESCYCDDYKVATIGFPKCSKFFISQLESQFNVSIIPTP